jgi:hypothetical protein
MDAFIRVYSYFSLISTGVLIITTGQNRFVKAHTQD